MCGGGRAGQPPTRNSARASAIAVAIRARAPISLSLSLPPSLPSFCNGFLTVCLSRESPSSCCLSFWSSVFYSRLPSASTSLHPSQPTCELAGESASAPTRRSTMTATPRDPEKDAFPPEDAPSHGDEPSQSSDSDEDEDEITEVGREGGRSRVEPDGGDHPAAGEAPVRPRSRASSTRSRALSVVARSKRRGLFAQLATIPEVDNPYNYTNKTKWTITLIIALAAAVSPMGSSIFYPALPEMAKEFGVSPTVTNLSVALYMLAMAIFPLWWSSFSETLGRRTIYLLSFILFVVFSILSAVSVNISMLIVMRLFGGGASASVQAVGAGTIADIWEPRERGRAMSIFYLGPLAGPLLAVSPPDHVIPAE
ncbi:MFS general substrate transporter [Colletotrichum caudatum]|nr:MFS general substrate transporter [Colletotrichum caudatum]